MSNNTTGAGDDADRGGESSTDWAEAIGDGGLVVVSNRQPYSHTYDGDDIAVEVHAGGLTAGLDPVMQAVGGTWIAWGDGDADREVVDENDCVAAPPEDPGYTLRRIWLSDEEVDDYYYGFSNQVLWPICHSALTRVNEWQSYWERYRTVNERFVEAVEDHAEAGDIVWFQDYHFALAPAIARERVDDETLLMQFWHIPWPAWDTFRGCPHGEAILEGLLGNDLLAFHVARYRENFLACVEAAVDDAVVDHETGTVSYDGRTTQVTEFPMGVQADEIAERAASEEAAAFWDEFRAEYDLADTVAVGVDRLDYSKGIPERLRALEQFWERNPEWRGELTYVENGSESRSQIRAYQDIQARIEEGVERVNDRFGTDDWTPVVSFRDYISKEALAGLYRNSDLALISPIRDGMNLVAQEYVAAQVDDDGVLVLSDQAGAGSLLDAAVMVKPQDTCAFTDAIEEALTMPEAERRARMRHLRRQVTENDLAAWTALNLKAAMALRDASGSGATLSMEGQP
ncbi:trehalose-6-phosphate synthase [Haloarcula sp. S1CR25-12]|uniref:Trehalose-6-phosphate synthase n=1 Tax=Haloarcula saliterrae TaxID=2950534 RepID=A0ABU2FGY4_9EURY|nr:trehalose-6-phosphate synthase [Haloarcula sp. S1CR25-12]MDS0261525.1 trehalose-6-phosphate synthase [Haloarcula sp. S1CR25-12]